MLRILESNFGPNDFTVAIHRNSLANLLRTTGRLVEAEREYLNALRISEALSGKDHTHALLLTLNNLIVCFYESNRLEDAEAVANRALDALKAFEEANGFEYPTALKIKTNFLGVLFPPEQDTDLVRDPEAEDEKLNALVERYRQIFSADEPTEKL